MTSMSCKLEPAIWSHDTGQQIPYFDRCQLIITWMFDIKEVHGKPRLHVDCWQSVFPSKFQQGLDYEETLFSLKENGTRHGRGADETKNRLQTLLVFLRIFTPVKII